MVAECTPPRCRRHCPPRVHGESTEKCILFGKRNKRDKRAWVRKKWIWRSTPGVTLRSSKLKETIRQSGASVQTVTEIRAAAIAQGRAFKRVNPWTGALCGGPQWCVLESSPHPRATAPNRAYSADSQSGSRSPLWRWLDHELKSELTEGSFRCVASEKVQAAAVCLTAL